MSHPLTNPQTWPQECHRFVEAGGNTTHAFGMGRMIGRVYSLLYLSPEAVSLEDIAMRLEMSKASVSIVVRQLSEIQAVRHTLYPGDRRDFYEAETDFMSILRIGILPGIRKKLESAGSQIQRTLNVAPVAAKSSTEPQFTQKQHDEIRRRLRLAQNLHRRLDRLLSSKLLARFL